MKPGYLYVLCHPSDPNLFKVGVTVLDPLKRLAQHNRLFGTHAGKIVKETGQRWQVKDHVAVADVYAAERAFWGATSIDDIPYRNGVEVANFDWDEVLRGLGAAASALPRRPDDRPKRNRQWMMEQLQGTGMVMAESYRGLVTMIQFECSKGHVFKESPGMVVNFRTCPCCVDWKFARESRSGLRASLR